MSAAEETVIRPEDSFDFKAPNYPDIFRARLERLNWLMADVGRIERARKFYANNIADFVTDWATTFDPRASGKGKPAYMPFILFPKQRDLVNWILDMWGSNEPGLIEKSREEGASWIAMCVSGSLCTLREDIHVGFISATEDDVDESGNPDCLFWKGRMFIDNLPAIFRPNYWSAHMRMVFPGTNSSITGDAGKNAGRGGRKSFIFLDEAAHIQHPLAVESSLSAATDCLLYISSASIDGMANHFAVKRHSGSVKVFTLHWRDDPRKDEEWAKKKKGELDPIVWAADYDIDYHAAAEGVIIPQAWVQAAIDAHVKLRIKPTGHRRGALDVADEGRDMNCFVGGHGILVNHCEVWSGKGSDTFLTTERACLLCDTLQLEGFDYDSDGIGASVRGDANQIATRRKEQALRKLRIEPYRSSAGVFQPDRKVPGTDRTALDMFQNLGAQAYFVLRGRFQETYRAVNGADDYNRDNIVSLSSAIPDLQKLCIELSQPQWKMSATGKIAVDKAPDDAMSPNRADAVRIYFAPRNKPMKIADSVFEAQEY